MPVASFAATFESLGAKDTDDSLSDNSTLASPPMSDRTHNDRHLNHAYGHPLSGCASQILNQLLAGFYLYRSANLPPASEKGLNDSSPAQTVVTYKQRAGKRKQASRGKRKFRDEGDEGGDNADDSDDERPPRRPKKARVLDPEVGKRLAFACPFFKHNPATHGNCHRYRLKRIRDVKQHLRRCHRKPVYCPICGQIFEDEESRDAHTREATCERNQINIEGITEAQAKKLSEKPSAKMTEEAQWFAVFAIVFPAHGPPTSPYVDPSLSEETQAFRDYVTREGPTLLLERLQANHVNHAWNDEDNSFLCQLLGDGLEELASRWAGSRHPSDQRAVDALPPVPLPAPAARDHFNEVESAVESNSQLLSISPGWPALASQPAQLNALQDMQIDTLEDFESSTFYDINWSGDLSYPMPTMDFGVDDMTVAGS